jgi:hypothetical protein
MNKNYLLVGAFATLWLIPTLLSMKLLDTQFEDITLFMVLFNGPGKFGIGSRLFAYAAVFAPLAISFITFRLALKPLKSDV